jgi:hypothetical protein
MSSDIRDHYENQKGHIPRAGFAATFGAQRRFPK